MAKPVPVEGLSPEMPLEEAAGKILPPLLGDAFARELAVRAGEPELGIHDMRVAMKRFREMFRLLRPAFPRKKHRRHLEWIEDANDALGEVREEDVLLAHLRALAGEDRTEPAISALLEKRRLRRDLAFEALLGELDRLHERGLRAKLEALIAESSTRREAGTLGAFAREEIRGRLDRARRRWRRAQAAATSRAFHRARIANKRLRYAIEPFRPFLPEEVSRAYETASEFHDALGDLHDADVLLEHVRKAMFPARPGDRAVLLRLAGRAEEARRGHLARLLDLGDRLEGGEWDRLEATMAAPPPDDEASPSARHPRRESET